MKDTNRAIKTLGITGGIGSGKSFIASMLQALGYKIYISDTKARKIMVSDPLVVSAIKALLGEHAYLANGHLNRPHISSLIFNDDSLLHQINQIVHPAVKRDFYSWLGELPIEYNKPFVFREAAIMYESGSNADNDYMLLVYAPKMTRVNRVMERDSTTKDIVLAKMDKQWSSLPKLLRSSYVIYNDEQHALVPQLVNALRYFSSMEKPHQHNQ